MLDTAPDAHATFGALLRHLRRRARLTQQELGIAVGYSESYITRLENDSRAPVPSMVEARFVDALQLQREPQLAQQLLRLARSAHPPAQGTAATQAATNLRPQLTRFIGRARELAEVRRLLASQRLVTLTGPGGVGKTRLSQEAAAGVLEHFVDGVWLIELAPLSDPALIARSIASLLRLPNQMAILSAETLAGHLASRHILLILDNCEHLIQACAELAETLLLNCPHLNILTTSREALHIPGEVAWPVPSLETGESVGLFADRAAAVRPEFTVTSQNASTVAAIGARLDGMPLAIELAASRLSGLSVEQLAARLDDRFRLLTGGMRTALPRHQTLRALIDWSHQLLTDQERILFRRLAVFVGGWTAEAAERVCAAAELDTHTTLHAPNVLPLLLNLVSKSLVLAETRDGETRYRMLETIREYALEQLTLHHEMDALRQQHARFSLAYVQEIAPRALRESGTPLHFVLGAESEVWAKRIAADHDNMRVALAWCLKDAADPASAMIGVHLVKWLNMFWHTHAHYAEALEWSGRALPHVDDTTDLRSRAQLQMLIANLASMVGDFAHADSASAEAVALFRRLDNQFELMRALQVRASQYLHSVDQATARTLSEEWLAIAREIGDRRHEGIALFWLGVIATQQGDLPKALEFHNASLRAIPVQDIGTRVATAFYLAETWWCMGDHARALAQCEQSLAHFREAGFAFGVATVLHRIGDIVLSQGSVARAEQCYIESVTMLYQQSARQRLLWPLAGLARLLAIKGRCFAALVLWTAQQAAGRLVGAPDAMICYSAYEAQIAAARASMSTEEIAEAERKGQALNLDQAVAYALSECAAN